MRPHTRDDIMILQKRAGLTLKDVLVLAPQNDPFNAGTETDIKRAKWFKDIWDRFGFSSGVHLRRMHYKILSYPDVKHWDGTPYQNTEKSWEQLGICSKKARYLKYVDAGDFIDRRNPDPVIYIETPTEEKEPGWWIEEEDISWNVPSIHTDFSELNMDLPDPHITGYDYELNDQAFHIELWIEKSTMDDILLPLCKRWGMNYVTSIGFQSLSSVISLIKRVRDSNKPGRVLYISDFDPAGDQMPSAVARQIEYWINEYGPDEDIGLHPVALSRDQVEKYNLPRTPLKDSDVRKGNFEALHGKGAVELDALEALYPGSLVGIIEEVIFTFFDDELRSRLSDAEREARRRLSAEWNYQMASHRRELETIRSDVQAVVSRYQERITQLSEEMAAELTPHQERLNDVRHAVLSGVHNCMVSLPCRPEPEPAGDVLEYLFSSRRGYLEQLAIYKRRYTTDPEEVRS